MNMAIDVNNLVRRLKKAREEREEAEAGRGSRAPPRQPTRVVTEEVQVEGDEVSGQPAQQPAEGEPGQATEGRAGGGSSGVSGSRVEEGGEDRRRLGLEPDPFEGGEQKFAWEETGEELEEVEKEKIDIRYPLVPQDPDEDEKVYAWAHIYYDEDEDKTIYRVNEPDLSERNERVLETIEERLKEKVDVDFGEMKRDEAREYLRDRIDEVLSGRSFHLDKETRDVIQYYAYRNFIGLGKIEPLMKDRKIEDISCDGVGVPVYVYHRNPDVGSVETNVVFEEEEELDSFVRKLAQRCGRSVSMAEPLVDGSLPDGSRVQATLGTDIARRGSNFTIREFTEDPLTPVDIMNFGTINAQMLSYLWVAIENGRSVLIAGPTAAGKTSLLNALSLFVPPELKVVSIEDTPELRLPHPNWVPEVARSGFGFQEAEGGEVTLDDLLEESLRQRPDYIIVGEVRGEEAYILFQQIATGHPGMSTIHASSLEKVMDRLTTRPINLPPSLIENLDIIIFIKRVRRQGTYVRRVDAVYELEDFNPDTERPVVNKIFEWDASTDSFKNVSDSSILVDIAKNRGIKPRKIQNEVVRRKEVMDWMREAGIDDYREVGRIAGRYYRDPESILERAEAGV